MQHNTSLFWVLNHIFFILLKYIEIKQIIVVWKMHISNSKHTKNIFTLCNKISFVWWKFWYPIIDILSEVKLSLCFRIANMYYLHCNHFTFNTLTPIKPLSWQVHLYDEIYCFCNKILKNVLLLNIFFYVYVEGVISLKHFPLGLVHSSKVI